MHIVRLVCILVQRSLDAPAADGVSIGVAVVRLTLLDVDYSSARAVHNLAHDTCYLSNVGVSERRSRRIACVSGVRRRYRLEALNCCREYGHDPGAPRDLHCEDITTSSAPHTPALLWYADSHPPRFDHL